MIIGFGSVEAEERQRVLEEMRAIMRQAILDSGELDFIDDKALKLISERADAKAKESQEWAEEYRKSTMHPDRYTRFWTHALCSASAAVVIVSFTHINRCHALSPDGWAAWSVEECAHVKLRDIRKSKQEQP